MRAKRRAAKGTQRPVVVIPPFPSDPAGELARWSRDVLKVPAGHPRAGDPMILPDYGVEFIRDALTHRESFLCIGRKNAKSAIVAVYLLGRLVGPLRVPGYRAGVCSVNKEKAGELKSQMEGIAAASGLDGLVFRRSPAPGRVESATGSVDILSADKSAGHASGFDDAIVDELGLFQERDRQLVNGMRSSTSAKDGRFLALSIQGDAPFTKELIDRADDPAVALHLYRAPDGCALDDPEAWHAANPGLRAGIKSLAYMADEARRVLTTPADQSSYRAFDLNQPQAPGREMVCTVADWEALLSQEPPARSGACVAGFDIGESLSMSGCVFVWPDTARMEVYAAFADTPNLLDRGMGASATMGDLYAPDACSAASCVTYQRPRGSAVAGVPEADLRGAAGPGSRVACCGRRTRFKDGAAVLTALDRAAGIRWPIQYGADRVRARRQGRIGRRAGVSKLRFVIQERLRPVPKTLVPGFGHPGRAPFAIDG